MNKPSGRAGRGRPAGQSGQSGQSDARARILEAARSRFLAEGYQAVTMRAIAADADVDVALVSYYFSSKQGVFGAALALPVNPLDAITGVLAAPDDQIADGLLRTFLAVWDAPESGLPLRSIAAAAIADPAVGRMVRELVDHELLPLIATRVGGRDATERAAGVVVAMAGLIFTRYLLRIEPLASMPADAVIAALRPVLDAALWPNRP
jgi:AcrR family transcriptional regulator